MAHFHVHVCQAFKDEQSPIDWALVTTSTALERPHLHHALLAFSAAHLAHQEQRRTPYTAPRMLFHHARAVTSMISELEYLTNSNADSLFLAASLLCLYEFATGPQDGQYLAFTDTGQPAEWIWLLKGVRSIVSCSTPRLLQSWLANSSDTYQSTADSDHVDKLGAQIAELDRQVPQLAIDPEAQQVYRITISRLKECNRSAQLEFRGKSLRPQTVFAWLYGLSLEFLQLLQAKDSMALLIFAHFNVLLHQLRHIWYLEKWSIHIIRGIERNMPREHRRRLLLSCEAIGYDLCTDHGT